MNVPIAPKHIRLIQILLLLLLGIGSVVYTQFLINNLREKERINVELWARAQKYVTQSHNDDIRADINRMLDDVRDDLTMHPNAKNRLVNVLERATTDLSNPAFDFVFNEIIAVNRFQIPVIRTDDADSILSYNNLNAEQVTPALLESYKLQNPPIRITMATANTDSLTQFVYFGESGIIQALRYFPYIQFGVLALFLVLAYSSWATTRRVEQSNVWVGMAREAAHQLGTPLTSLYGWITLLKESDLNKENLQIVHEIDNDVERLQSVADRFSKIGSAPELRETRVGIIVNNVADYMERRIPQMNHNIVMIRDIETDTRLMLNHELFQWALENLLKNAIDAIDPHQAGSQLLVRSKVEGTELHIEIEDTGKGIEKRLHKEVFKPGFSTKKRGWGLGLSLTKRIVEEYHGGKVFVLRSQPGKGTTFRISLPVT